ncbi:MAG: molybdenum cofactor biosynthesis protein MoaE [Rhodothermales bacterium]|nr:molybdenum cofactor biosynthesis protein MoaE [Rhodothermales bacterium]
MAHAPFYIHLTTDPLDVGAAFAFLQSPAAGGIDLFVGTTRRWTGEEETARLVYDAYVPMAEREMRRLAEDAAARWPLEGVYLVHRLGEVPPAEASVIVGVASAHRAEAFAACRYLIDTLKKAVPIWKREVYADGREEWVEGATPVPEGDDRRA